MKDDFGDRMKLYENQESSRKLIPLLPVVARLDGKAFHGFTSDLPRPYDERLSELMMQTTEFLIKETDARIGYTQSDEISLTWHSLTFDKQILFDGRVQKMVSVISSLCTGYFNSILQKLIPSKKELGFFDCRVFNVPNLDEGANVFLWREKDATKNSISMATRAYYKHSEMVNKNSSQMQEMLFQKGINWNDYPTFFKRGTFIQKKFTKFKFTAEELSQLPEAHHARKNPDLEYERGEYKRLDMPPFTKVLNRAEVIYFGAEPILIN